MAALFDMKRPGDPLVVDGPYQAINLTVFWIQSIGFILLIHICTLRYPESEFKGNFGE